MENIKCRVRVYGKSIQYNANEIPVNNNNNNNKGQKNDAKSQR